MKDRATVYAESVINGTISRPVGNTEVLTAQRFLKDLEKQGTPEFPFVFNEKKANHILDFSENLILDEGDEPQPFHAADFQAFIFENWNGWVIKDTNNRRFRTSYIQIGRQNGKSVMNSIPALYYGNFAGYKYPQIYCVATKELQAKIVLKECYKFIKADKELAGTKTKPGLFTIQDYKSEILCNLTGGTIKALGRDTDSIDGFRPFFGSVDEYHKHKTNQMYKLLTDGDKKMKSCLVSIITTAGFDLNSPCKTEYDYGINILNGVKNDSHFVYIAEPDEADTIGDKIYEENIWPKAHPLWTPETLISLQTDANQAREKGGQDLLDFQTKDLNLWVAATKNGYINKKKWNECACDKTLADMEGRGCYLGLDLSSGGDLTAGVLEFPLENDSFYIDAHAFMPSSRLMEHEKSDKAPYREWVADKQLTLTETLGGYKTDYKYILNYYKELIQKYHFRFLGIAYDPHNADTFLQDLDEFGCDLVPINQSAKSLNDATDDFKNSVDARKILYSKDAAMLTWCFFNATTVSNSFKEIKVDKEHRTSRIDPVDATIDAHKLAIANKSVQINVADYLTDGTIDRLWGI
ncbi:MAG TPA: terminase TerL endonuclease subunit [Caproicibacter sp.]|nr:terminase TerL endonuclease subunit [Caproicibacter sp.]